VRNCPILGNCQSYFAGQAFIFPACSVVFLCYLPRLNCGYYERNRKAAHVCHYLAPGCGKTTLTEKLLLYGGAVQLAGSVTARKNQRATTSDWMELEKKRGISISSTVLQFEYDGYRINLLDTPGHKDFSEDTYRVLTAVDSVVMVIDSAKGIEPQTRKLFEVCRQRAVPIFTFMNKCDRPMKNPLELLDELERVLGIGAFPVNWPIGNGFDFQGVYDRQTQLMHLFERTVGGQFRAPVQVGGLHDEIVRGRLDDETFHKTVEELEMLEHAGHDWDDAAVLSEKKRHRYFLAARAITLACSCSSMDFSSTLQDRRGGLESRCRRLGKRETA
jgi:peptide chain release factor 3